MKKILLLLTICLFLLCGCDTSASYSFYAYDVFDTVISFTAICRSEREAKKYSGIVFSTLQNYDRQFDIYEHKDGITNLFDVNANAGHPVQVDKDIIELMDYCIDAYSLSKGRVNCAMGSVLSLWHRAREDKVLPKTEELKKAAGHCDIGNIAIDRENNMMTLLDPEMSLDVGAVAKGWAVQKAAAALEDAGCRDYILSAGGNVVCGGSNMGKPWKIGIQDPNGSGLITTVSMNNGAVVTSGGYNRYAEIDGQLYHHIIDRDTLMPANTMKSVTVICDDSAMADVLSTYFFQLPPEAALENAEMLGVQVVIVDIDGNILCDKALKR